ncbi:MAG: guanylate kinase [Chitinophagaceae bacterium]
MSPSDSSHPDPSDPSTSNPGKLIILTAPSGSGKTTLVKHLLSHHPQLAFSISACTRPARAQEKDGKDYYFIDPATFRKKIEEGAFAEYEMVYEGKYYGTLKSELHRIWKMGKTPLIDIDVQGALALKREYPSGSLTIFIEPPSLKLLEQRLQARETESAQTLRERILKAAHELSFSNRFDRILINDQLEVAKREADQMVREFLEL